MTNSINQVDEIQAHPLEKYITFEIEVLPEDTPLKGNVSAIDPEIDTETERKIQALLDAGCIWAWCIVRVTGTLGALSYTTYLGACSYSGQKDFENCLYFADMKYEISLEIQKQFKQLCELMAGIESSVS